MSESMATENIFHKMNIYIYINFPYFYFPLFIHILADIV